MSIESTAVKNKTQALAAVRRMNKLHREIEAIDDAHMKAAADEKAPLEEELGGCYEELRAFGVTVLPVEDGDGEVQMGNAKLYRDSSAEVVCEIPEKEIIEILKKNPRWKRRFLRKKVTFELNRKAVHKHPYITNRDIGLRIRRKLNLYLLRGKSSKPEILSEHELDSPQDSN